MTFPAFPATNGTDAQSLLFNAALAQGLQDTDGGLSQLDLLALVVGNMLIESPNGVVNATALAASLGAANGLGLMRVARATFDPSSDPTQRPIGAHGLGVTLPAHAIVVGGFIQTNIAFTSAGAATIAAGLNTASDITGPGAFGGALWALGLNAIDPKANTPQTTGIVLPVAREIVFTVAVAALTAGKATVFLNYVIGA